jgi:hypothetical protein
MLALPWALRLDYVYPGGSSLMDRGVYDSALLEAEYLARTAPHALSQKIADGYLRGFGCGDRI